MKTPPIITKHAKQRLKERLGLPKRSHVRHIYRVIRQGQYLFRDMKAQSFYMHYAGVRYVFGWSPKLEPVLVTVLYDSDDVEKDRKRYFDEAAVKSTDARYAHLYHAS